MTMATDDHTPASVEEVFAWLGLRTRAERDRFTQWADAADASAGPTDVRYVTGLTNTAPESTTTTA